MFVLARFDHLMFNSVTVMCVLLACEKLGIIEPAKEIHVFVIRGGFELDVFARIALMNMYANCNIIGVSQILDSPSVSIVSFVMTLMESPKSIKVLGIMTL